ncbi:T9SS type A sorting domain-containing protein [bacterium]|nr:T9SS type A sorting domain-containing protein [bacterium]
MRTIFISILLFVVLFGGGRSLSAQTVVDTLYMYNPDDLFDQPIIVFDWTYNIFTYFEVNSSNSYDVIAVEFQLVSEIEEIHPSNPYEDIYPITFWEGTLEGELELGRELYPTEDTGNPIVDIFSALPGHEAASMQFVIPDSTYLYPNWYHIPLDTIGSLQGLTENIWVGGTPFIWYMVCDFGNLQFANTFDNQNHTYWRIQGPARAIRLIIEYEQESSVHEQMNQPSVFVLYPPFPNPFNPSTSIMYNLPERSNVTLSVFDITGRNIRTIVSESKPAGHYESQWNGTDDEGQQVPAGMYFARLEAGDYSSVIKMVYLR